MLPETDLHAVYVPAPFFKGSFPTLADAVKNLPYPDSYIENIIRQNIRYRDYEREHGARAVTERLINEAPILGQNQNRISRAIEYLESNPIGNNDIQCHPISAPMTLGGHTFANFAELRKAVELIGPASFFSDNSYYTYTPERHTSIDGLHIGLVYANYPRFDSSDDCDNRSYQNYIICDRPITPAMLKELAQMQHRLNYCIVTEQLSAEWLPLVYYEGDYNYLKIATPRTEAQS